MKGTGRIIIGIFSVCSLVMIYVHLQVATFLASYEIDRAASKIHSATEQLRKLKFEMDQFKAPHLLEGQVRQHEMKLAIPKMVYRIPYSFDEIQANSVALPTAAQTAGAPQFLRQVLSSWIQVAHAKNNTSET